MVKEFTISRVFEAPKELLWKSFTEPDHMAQWWGPKEVHVIHSKMDFRPEGTYHYGMKSSSGEKSWGRMVFKEIVPNKKLVFINSFSDEKGNLTRHPSAKLWPLEMLSTFTLSDVAGETNTGRAGQIGQTGTRQTKTQFTITWIPINASAKEEKTFDEGRKSMTQGWTGSLDRLDEYLKTLQEKKEEKKVMQKIIPHLWFDKEAGEAAKFYTSIFKDSRIISSVTLHDTPSGTAELITIELLGQEFNLISAGPYFKFNEAVSFIVPCETQEEIDYYWKKLSAVPEAEQCGWLKDKYGLSWQITPTILKKMMSDKDPKKVARVTQAFLKMKKFNIKELEKAYKTA